MRAPKGVWRSLTLLGWAILAAAFAAAKDWFATPTGIEWVEWLAGVVGSALTIFGRWRIGDLYVWPRA